MTEDGRLLVAVPSKGRMAPPALELLAAAGLRFEAGERALHVPSQNAPVDLLLVRPHDIPEYVQDGVVHAGITGAFCEGTCRARSPASKRSPAAASSSSAGGAIRPFEGTATRRRPSSVMPPA